MERAKIHQTLSQPLSPSNCIKIRNTAMNHSDTHRAVECDSYIGSALNKMLVERDFLSLPRLQVNVDISDRFVEFGTDSNMIEDTVYSVVTYLQGADTTIAFLEEKVVELALTQDHTLASSDSLKNSNTDKALSPEKSESRLFRYKMNDRPSPARKLILSETESSEVFTQPIPWKMLGIEKMSELCAIGVVANSTSSLLVLNVNLMSSDKQVPVSPTTGLTYTCGNALISSMKVARCGFAAIASDSGLISIGGYNREGVLSNAEHYDLLRNSWEVMRGELNVKRARFTAVECQGKLYAIGGSNGQVELGSTEIYNPDLKSWIKIKSRMVTPRSCFGATVHNGCIYAAGGTYYSTPLKSVEMFDPQLGYWRSQPPMLTTRNCLALTSCNGRVYAIGGQTSGWRCLETVECYDPVQKMWKRVASMKTPRRNAAVVTVDEKIYVIGGYNGFTAVNSVEIYDPSTNEWSPGPPMALRRSNPAAVSMNGCIYVVGGFNGSTFLNSLEHYNIETKQWSSYV